VGTMSLIFSAFNSPFEVQRLWFIAIQMFKSAFLESLVPRV